MNIICWHFISDTNKYNKIKLTTDKMKLNNWRIKSHLFHPIPYQCHISNFFILRSPDNDSALSIVLDFSQFEGCSITVVNAKNKVTHIFPIGNYPF